MRRNKHRDFLQTSTRELLADKILDLANLTFIALVFGNILRPEGFEPLVAIFGVLFALICYVVAIIMKRT